MCNCAVTTSIPAIQHEGTPRTSDLMEAGWIHC